MWANCKHRGTVAVTAVLLIIIVLAVLSIVRYFWVDSANEHFDKLISVYIIEKEDFSPDDRDTLKARLLEEGLFIKMYKWNRGSFIKDRELYNDMIVTRDQREMRQRKSQGSIIDTMINL